MFAIPVSSSHSGERQQAASLLVGERSRRFISRLCSGVVVSSIFESLKRRVETLPPSQSLASPKRLCINTELQHEEQRVQMKKGRINANVCKWESTITMEPLYYTVIT